MTAGGAATILMSGMALAAVGAFGANPASATNNNPTGNPTSPAVTYELDCVGGGLAAGQTAPFIVGTVMNTTVNTGDPTGTTFGVAGAVSTVLSGAVVAPLNAALNPASVSLQTNATFGATDGNSTGTYAYAGPTITLPNPGGQITGATWATASTTINLAAAPATGIVGDLIAASPTSAPPGFPPATTPTVITAESTTSPFSITISNATTAANTTAATLGYAPAAGITFTDAAMASPTSAFTTNGVVNGTAGIGVTGSTGITMTLPGGISLPFGVSPNTCKESGYFGTTAENTPLFPAGTTTGMVSATQFESGAFVSLTAATPPVPNANAVSIGEGGSGTVQLTATQGTYPVNPAGFTLVGGSPQTITLTPSGTMTVTLDATTGVVTITNTATVAASGTFQFNACDTLAAANGGPLCSTTPATVTVTVGTPPVTQPFSEQVTGGQLVLSCDSPSNYVTVGTGNVGTKASPLLTCPEFQFPAITLNGLEQQVTGTTGESGGNPSASAPGTIYISDNRGASTDAWTLTGTFIASPSNTNTACAGVIAFCLETLPGGASAGTVATQAATNGAVDGQIQPKYLQVSKITCTADATGGLTGPDGTIYNPPNLNPDATPTAGGNFGPAKGVTLCAASAGQSGGTFLYNATYTLTIPESVYAGNYVGSIQFTVA